MSDKKFRISLLQPAVLPDNRRITLEMTVEGLPAPFGGDFAGCGINRAANVSFFPEMSNEPGPPPTPPAPDEAEQYPNIELSILNSRRQQMVNLFIIEHKEQNTALTLHLPAPNPQEQYTARAEMSFADEIIDVVETPFILNQVN